MHSNSNSATVNSRVASLQMGAGNLLELHTAHPQTTKNLGKKPWQLWRVDLALDPTEVLPLSECCPSQAPPQISRNFST